MADEVAWVDVEHQREIALAERADVSKADQDHALPDS